MVRFAFAFLAPTFPLFVPSAEVWGFHLVTGFVT